jgi:hypothetical protein
MLPHGGLWIINGVLMSNGKLSGAVMNWEGCVGSWRGVFQEIFHSICLAKVWKIAKHPNQEWN